MESKFLFERKIPKMVPEVNNKESINALKYSLNIAFKRLKIKKKKKALKKSLKEILNGFLVKKENEMKKISEKETKKLLVIKKVLEESERNPELKEFLNKPMYELHKDFLFDKEGFKNLIQNKKDKEKFEKKNKDFIKFTQKPLVEFDEKNPSKIKSCGYFDYYFLKRPGLFVDYVNLNKRSLDD